MGRRGEPRATRSLAATALATGHKGAGGRPAKKLLRKADNAKALQAQLAFLTAMVAELQDKLEAQAKMPARYAHPLARTSETFAKPMATSTATPRGVEGAEALAAAAYSQGTDISASTDSSTTDVSRETTADTPPASVPSTLDGYEKRLEAMGLRVPVPVVPDEIWQFLEGAEAIEDGHLRLQKYQAAMRAFGRYYTQIGEVDRGFQVVLMLTNQMKDMYMARSKSAGGYLVRESELAALEAEISGMSDEELAESEDDVKDMESGKNE